MSNFEPAVAVLLHIEAHQRSDGVWDKFWNTDVGGETAWGVSKVIRDRFHITPEECGVENFEPGALKKMPMMAAVEIYRKHFWERMEIYKIKDQNVATQFLVAAVNFNPPEVATALAQQALHALERRDVEIDGILGPQTINAINNCDPATYFLEFAHQLGQRYHAIAAIHPGPEYQGYLHDWLVRANWGLAPGTVV